MRHWLTGHAYTPRPHSRWADTWHMRRMCNIWLASAFSFFFAAAVVVVCGLSFWAQHFSNYLKALSPKKHWKMRDRRPKQTWRTDCQAKMMQVLWLMKQRVKTGGKGEGRRRRAETKPKVAIIKLHFVNAAVAISNRERERERRRGDKERGEREWERERGT